MMPNPSDPIAAEYDRLVDELCRRARAAGISESDLRAFREARRRRAAPALVAGARA